MPALTATADHAKPFVLVPVKQSDLVSARDCATNFCDDGWLEKVFERQEAVKVADSKKHKNSFIQRTLKSLTHHHSKDEMHVKKNSYDEHSYQEELQRYIAESSANLHYDGDGPLNSSDEDTSDEDLSPRNAEVIDFSAFIASTSSDKVEEFVEPPVQVPRSYRTQDRQGGVLVAGHRVLFTNWAFKRERRHLGGLGPLPERREAVLPSLDEVEEEFMRFYSGKIVEL
ncbi:Palmitoyltransferase ZDHHC17 [Phytophthora cinnamomi]|uniref:Palmitoyltransferase ZDHHC17 n=1 Tax=Phytophthora cinnamomi TaxID=4785 RepID=UPI00355ACA8F|nr:Palmitoyltransferase ZDHHC17 [Phytophthora cinnamomi]